MRSRGLRVLCKQGRSTGPPKPCIGAGGGVEGLEQKKMRRGKKLAPIMPVNAIQAWEDEEMRLDDFENKLGGEGGRTGTGNVKYLLSIFGFSIDCSNNPFSASKITDFHVSGSFETW